MARAVSTPTPAEERLKLEEKAASLSDGSDPMVDCRKEGDRDEGSDSEEDKVVVERNGQFLLVSKSELEAELTLPSESSTEPNASLVASQSTVDGRAKVPSGIQRDVNQHGRQQLQVDFDYSHLPPRPSSTVSPACSTREEPTCPGTDSRVDCSSSLSKHSLDSASSGGLGRGAGKSTPPPQSFTRPINSYAHAKFRLASAPASRSHSAPWLTANPPTVKGSLLGGDGEEEERRRHLNDESFRSWLARKNRERVQRQKERGADDQEVGEEERRVRNNQAFHSWLANKQKQLHPGVALRPVTALPQSQGASSTRGKESPEAAYEGWVMRKQDELQSRKKLEVEKRKGAREKANDTDLQAGDKAFQM